MTDRTIPIVLLAVFVVLVLLLAIEVLPGAWRVVRTRGEAAEAPKVGTLDCGCTSAVIYSCMWCGDTRCATHREAIHPCSKGDPGEAFCTDADTSAAEPSVLLEEIYAYLEGQR